MIKQAECIRTVANFSKIDKEYKFDKKNFDKNKFKEDLPNISPKLEALLKKIKELDAEDLETD